MPMLIPVVVAAVASIGTYAAIGAATVSILGFTVSTTLVAGIVGSIAAAATSLLVGAAFAQKPKAPAGQEAQDRKQLIRSPVSPRQVVYGWQRVGGDLVYASSTGADQRFLHLVVVLASHPVQKIGTFWLNEYQIGEDQLPPPGADGVVRGFPTLMRNKVYVEKYLGNQTTACAALVNDSTDGWSSSHVGRNQAYLYLRLEYDRDLFAGGLQKVEAEVEGKRDLFDPRTGGSLYSTNSALVVLDYLRGSHGIGAPASAIDLASFSAAANICDEAVPLDASGLQVQARYDCNMAFRRDLPRREVLRKLLSSCGGTLVWIQGRYRLYVGAYQTPTDTLGEGDVAGPIRLTTRTSLREQVNGVKGTFISPAHQWQAQEFPAVTSGPFLAEDGGTRRWRDLELPATINAIRAQRLARMELLRARQQEAFEAPVKYAGLRYGIWQMLSVTLPDFGWSAKPFRVAGWTFRPASGELFLRLRAEAAANYAWIHENAAALPAAPSTNLVNPLDIPAPTGVTLTPATAVAPDGTTVPALIVEFTPSATAFLTGTEIWWRVLLGGWNAVEVPPGVSKYEIRPVTLGETYQVQVRGVTALARSAWSGLASGTGTPDTNPPNAPSGVTATGVVRGVSLRWTNDVASDLDRTEVWEAPAVGGPFAKVRESYSDFAVVSGLNPGETRFYRLRHVDHSGNLSAFSATVSGTATRLITDDLNSGAVSSAATIQVDRNNTLTPPVSGGSGYQAVSLAAVIVSFDGDGRAVILMKFPRFRADTASQEGGGGTGGGE